MTTEMLEHGIIMHTAEHGFVCNGDDSGCSLETVKFYEEIMKSKNPISSTIRTKTLNFLKDGDGSVLDKTHFQHLRNVEEHKFKTWCPMADFALTYVSGWDRKRFEAEGLAAFMTELVRLCATCGATAKTHCAQCKSTRYCSKKCQSADWKRHKMMCDWEN